MSTLNASAPVLPEAAAVPGKYGPTCGACGARLPASIDVWRCPWVACRKWLRGLAELTEKPLSQADIDVGRHAPPAEPALFDAETLA